MANVTTVCPSTDCDPLPPSYRYKPVRAPARGAPTVAYGFILDYKCRMRWARWYYEAVYGEAKLAAMTPEEANYTLDLSDAVSGTLLPGLIYSEFPQLLPLRNRLLPIVGGKLDPECYIFVLRDDATWQGMNAPLDPKVVEEVGRRLGVAGQEPNWYKIDLGAK